jgi:superfamily II DNA or RNA helicase
MNTRPDVSVKPIDHVEERRRTLMDTVRQLSLAAFFSRATLKLAEALATRNKHWHSPLAWFQPDGSSAQALQCEVDDADGRLRCVMVYLYTLFGEDAIDSRCSCAQERCAHAAAMLMRLQQLLDWPRAMTPVQRWKQRVETMREPTARKAASSELPECWPLRALLCLDEATLPARLCVRLVLAQGADTRRWLSAEHAQARPHLSRQAMLWQAQLATTQSRRRAGESDFVLDGHGGAALLDEWLQAGICRHADNLQEIHAGAPRQPCWQWRQDARGDARVALHWPEASDVRLIELDGLRYLDLTSGELGPLQLSRAAWEIVDLMPPVPPSEATALAAEWPPHPLLASVPSPPPPPRMQRVAARLRPIVILGASRHLQRGDYVFHVRALADYDGCRLPLADEPWQRSVVRRDRCVIIQRDIEGEVSAWHALEQTGLTNLTGMFPDVRRTLAPVPDARALGHRDHCQGGAETFAALEAALQALCDAGFTLEYDPDLPFIVLPHETRLRAVLDDGERAGWAQFELAANVDGEEIDVLPIVLGGLAQHAFSLTPVSGEPRNAHWLAPVGTNRWLPLPLAHLREWLAPLMACLDRSPNGDERQLQLPRLQAMALSESLQQQGVAVEGALAADVAETLAALREAATSLSAVAPPAAFHGELRRYQLEGLRWLQTLRKCRLGGVLADDMGLGKTVQIIAHLLVEKEAGRLVRPALIVAPTSLVFNWLDEIGRFAPSLQCVNYTGSRRSALLGQLALAQVIVTSYTLLAIDLDALKDFDYSMLVMDEAQWIKNPLTQAARAVRKLRAAHRLVVTGTPLENHLGELWAHFDAVLPGYLGDYRSFNRNFRQPIEQHEDDVQRAMLRRRIAPFLLRRDKASVAPELPPKTETVLRISMGEPQRRLYESLRLAQSARVREALAQYNHEQSRIIVLSALLRLRQVCCDPRLLDELTDPPGSAKLDALLELVQSLREDNRQILVFSQFTSMLALIGTTLDEARLEYAVLTGDTGDRSVPVRRFQSGAVPILLASLKAGGVGLNLTAADAVIHYEPWWNPAVETQAIDRAHRIGREQPVFVYKLLCEDTIEEKVEAMKSQKSELADALLKGAATPLARLDADDLYKLFDAAESGHELPSLHAKATP